MSDYALFMDSAGITRKDAIKSLSAKYPKFGKATMTMVCNPDDYGVALIPDAEKKLIDDFGVHAGITLRRRRADANRKKKNRLTVRLDDSLFEQVSEVYRRSAFCSMQDMIEAAIVEFVNRRR